MDYIDRKLEQDKLKRSVVKYWNVNYSLEQKKIGPKAPEKVSKKESGKAESGKKTGRDMNYNPYTGANSGDYGKQPVAAEQAEVIDSILDEKKFDLEKILEDPDAAKKAETQQEAASAHKVAAEAVASADVSAKAAMAVEEAKAASKAAEETAAAIGTPQKEAQTAAEAMIKEAEK